MFEKAARLKLRFTHKGPCSVEDLWEIPLRDLDTIFKGLNAQLKSSNEDSLLTVKTAASTTLELQIKIVKHVVTTRLQEQQDREDSVDKKAQKERILGIIAKKQDEALEGKSIEELEKMV